MELLTTPVKDIYFRKANKDDSPLIRELIFSILKSYNLNTDHLDTDNDLIDLEKYYPEGHFWVLSDQKGQIKGCFALYHPGNQKVEIRRMYFHPTVRGLGLGKWALSFLEMTARNMSYKTLWLETTSALKEAIELYKKLGFQHAVGTCHSCRCDVVMEKKLIET